MQSYQSLIDYLNSRVKGAKFTVDASLDYASFEKNYQNRKPGFVLPNPWQTHKSIKGLPGYGYAVSPIIYKIRRERLIELAFEGFRWDNICHWNAGKLIENPKTIYYTPRWHSP